MPAGGFYLWIPAPDGDAWALTERMAREAGAQVLTTNSFRTHARNLGALAHRAAELTALSVRLACDARDAHARVEPEAAGIRAMHPEDLQGSRDKLFMFLSGWLGGPDLFVEKFGHPRLRGRHMPFAIGTSERDQWVALRAVEPGSAQVDRQPQ